MPFKTFTWEDGSVKLGRTTPDPELRQIDEDRQTCQEASTSPTPAFSSAEATAGSSRPPAKTRMSATSGLPTSHRT